MANLTRRQALQLGAAMGLGALRPSFATAAAEPAAASAPRAATRALYDAALVIDACGGPGDLAEGSGPPLPAATIEAISASGVSAVNLTIGSVGAMPSA